MSRSLSCRDRGSYSRGSMLLRTVIQRNAVRSKRNSWHVGTWDPRILPSSAFSATVTTRSGIWWIRLTSETRCCWCLFPIKPICRIRILVVISFSCDRCYVLRKQATTPSWFFFFGIVQITVRKLECLSRYILITKLRLSLDICLYLFF